MINKIIAISIDDVLPSVPSVLKNQGIPYGKRPNDRTMQLAQDAIDLYHRNAAPVGMLLEMTKDEFRVVFEGENRNETDSPVGPIFQTSSDLALFAVTIGEKVCAEIQRLFKTNDFALGSMLDSVASEGTDLAAQYVESFYHEHLKELSIQKIRQGVLRFSPGYCGWHISSQKKLFEALHPGEIGITLNESHLMKPLKSISGVIIFGEKDIFTFDDTFSFCRDCADHACRERILTVMNQ